MSSIKEEHGNEVGAAAAAAAEVKTTVRQKSEIDLNELQLKLTNLQLSKMEGEEKNTEEKSEVVNDPADIKPSVLLQSVETEILPQKKGNPEKQEETAIPTTSTQLNKDTAQDNDVEQKPSTLRLSSSTSGNNSVQEDEEEEEEEVGEEFATALDRQSPTLSNAVTASPLPVSEANSEEKIDVGMGSSIECSEESEEDDELKPLAIDNHVLSSSPRDAQLLLSESNLEKFHLQMDNNYHSERGPITLVLEDITVTNPDGQVSNTSALDDEDSLVVNAIVPSNSPVDIQMRVHHTFLNMKKKSIGEKEVLLLDETQTERERETEKVEASVVVEKAQSIVSQNSNKSENDEEEKTGEQENEIDNLPAELIPDDELATQIVEAVEYYFSNDCILKDAFLLKHVRRNKEGFVSLKLVSSFKRVRQLTKDWRVVGYAIRHKSERMLVNEVGTKVRRLEALPVFDETMPSRTVVATDLPMEKMTIEKVSEIFAKCGEIALIRLLKPGMTIPIDVRQFMNKHPELLEKECALVEYLDSASARNALQLEGAFKIYEMVAPKKKTGKKAVVGVMGNSPVSARLLMDNNYHHHHQQHSDFQPLERPRGGSFSGFSAAALPAANDLRYKLKRYNSDVYQRIYAQQHPSQYTAAATFDPSEVVGDAASLGGYHHPSLQTSAVGRTFRPRGGSLSYNDSNFNYSSIGSRRYSTNLLNNYHHQQAYGDGEIPVSSTIQRRYSTLPQEGSSTTTTNMEIPRRLSTVNNSNNFTDSTMLMMSRRDSNCSVEHSPPLTTRRLTPPEYVTGDERMFRKTSQASSTGSGERRFSNSSMHYEGGNVGGGGGVGNPGEGGYIYPRRLSNEYNTIDRKLLETQLAYHENGVQPTQQQFIGGEHNPPPVFHQPRRYSNNNFHQLGNAAKLAMYDNAQYINGRRISTDSGYDRRCSFGSEYEGSPRSRTGSFLVNDSMGQRSRTGSFIGQFDSPPRSRTGSFLENNGGTSRSRSGSFAQRAAEALVRTPLGPDGSKGFGSRLRKTMETIQTVN